MTTKAKLDVLTLLRSVDALQDVETKQLNSLAAIANPVKFEKDEVLYSPGDAGKSLYLVKEGQVAIEIITPNGEQVTISTVGANQFFGWSSLFPSERKMARTRATEPTLTVAFSAAQLRAAWQKDRELEYVIIRQASKAMTERVKASRYQLANLFTKK